MFSAEAQIYEREDAEEDVITRILSPVLCASSGSSAVPSRAFPDTRLESVLWNQGLEVVAGVDEAGVGPICGPVVAAAVALPAGSCPIDGVRDSKMLSGAQREVLLPLICSQALAVGVGAASVDEIDRLNVLRATHLAMCRALARLGRCDHAIVDGRPIRDVALGPHTAVVDGDAKSYSVACASIVAKVTRDRLMRRLAVRCPGYGWEHNAGYGTEEHLAALRRLGPTPYHRRSYAPVRAVLEAAAPAIR
jgi:ribonuclease HII